MHLIEKMIAPVAERYSAQDATCLDSATLSEAWPCTMWSQHGVFDLSFEHAASHAASHAFEQVLLCHDLAAAQVLRHEFLASWTRRSQRDGEPITIEQKSPAVRAFQPWRTSVGCLVVPHFTSEIHGSCSMMHEVTMNFYMDFIWFHGLFSHKGTTIDKTIITRHAMFSVESQS